VCLVSKTTNKRVHGLEKLLHLWSWTRQDDGEDLIVLWVGFDLNVVELMEMARHGPSACLNSYEVQKEVDDCRD
jgi:hypothetical protein